MVKFENVNKKFDSKAFALSEINFEIGDGEFAFITGPSGAGKTTILRLIIHDLLPTSGKILVENFELHKLKPAQLPRLRQKIGMVFQDFRLLWDRTVFENVAIALELIGIKEEEIEKKVKEVLARVSLTEQINLFPTQLAGGELQRTGLARALVASPKIVLADEPTGNLDPKTAREILDLLLKVNEAGTTVIMASHNVDIVNSAKKRVITLDKGKIVKDEKEGKYENL